MYMNYRWKFEVILSFLISIQFFCTCIIWCEILLTDLDVNKENVHLKLFFFSEMLQKLFFRRTIILLTTFPCNIGEKQYQQSYKYRNSNIIRKLFQKFTFFI